jgi:8-oxo-dGTP pyrophosphatase MutT (NUDIX family)
MSNVSLLVAEKGNKMTRTIIKREPVHIGQFLSVEHIHYTVPDKENEQFIWEAINNHDTVHILVYNKDTDKLLLTKQTRIPSLRRGIRFCIEACAGIIDKYEDYEDTPHRRARMIAADEIQEELGYKISPINDLEALPKYIGSTGTSGSTCYPFYCQVTDEQFTGQQLKDNEDIEIFEISPCEIKVFLENTTNIDATTRYLLYWWLGVKRIAVANEKLNYIYANWGTYDEDNGCEYSDGYTLDMMLEAIKGLPLYYHIEYSDGDELSDKEAIELIAKKYKLIKEAANE